MAARIGVAADDPWLRQLTEHGPADVELRIDAEVLRHLEVPDDDAAELTDLAPNLIADDELWWLLRAESQRMTASMGEYGHLPGGPHLPAGLGAVGRYFYAFVFLAVLPEVRAFHARHAIPDDVSWASLADLGEKLALHRRSFGTGGMRTQFWFTLHQRGVIYRLGRLQFNQQRSDGHPVLGTHIPEWGGPLSPRACGDSLRQARRFFAAHFPGFDPTHAACSSWLLDPQLAEYLPATSNIVAFQRMFRLLDAEPEPVTDGRTPGDRSVLEFVFRSPGTALDELPQRTTLQRAAVAHLMNGRHWAQRSGSLPLR
ncbi:MAG: acyltransferase domain-containing protein [Jatrophihabitans sp.]